jgi:DNA polymerase III delta prime subunit
MSEVNEYILNEKYRPQTIEECILPEQTKTQLQDFVSSGKMPNLLFCGTSGIGKTTSAYALANEMEYDVLYVNASNEGRSIDTLRGIITEFATTMSLYANRKVVILDEFDGTTALVQEALRAFVEQYSITCSFILTANNRSKLSPAMISRFSEINFTIPAEEKTKVGVAFMKRIVEILNKEGIEFDKSAVAELVKKFFPDFRRTLNELQKFSSGGKFTMEQLANIETDINSLVGLIKDKNFTEAVSAVETMSSIDITSISNELYNNMDKFATPNDKPIVIKLMSDYIDKGTRTTNPKITVLALLAELMASLD